MDKIKRFVECLIPVTACNLKCGYCYVIQRDNRKGRMAEMKYSPEQVGIALSKSRWGGCCYFSICGAGETTLQIGLEDIVYQILKQGHYVNITTNGTITTRLKSIIEKAAPYIERLHFAFSFHYNELQRLNMIQKFFDNVNMVKGAGASFCVQLNLCDEYIEQIEEIKKLCIQNIGALPQVAATRKEDAKLQNIEIFTDGTVQKYILEGEKFDSPLFRFTMKNFNVRRKEFCYAGDWSAILDLSTGIMRRCYCSYIYQNIFENPREKIRFLAMGNFCGSPFCMNSSHFMSLGVIPSIDTPCYAELRNRPEAGWYGDRMNKFLQTKLADNNKRYGFWKKVLSICFGIIDTNIRVIYRSYKNLKKGAL